MSSGNADLARLLVVEASVNKFVVDGKRSARVVADWLQFVIGKSDEELATFMWWVNERIISEKAKRVSVSELVTPGGAKRLMTELENPGSVVRTEDSPILRIVPGAESLDLPATDGTETLAQATDVFSLVDRYFTRWGTDVPSEATEATRVSVYEMARDASFSQMFASFGKDLKVLFLTQHQIKKIVQTHQQHLRADGCNTFFPFKVGAELFVASVRLALDGEPEERVFRFMEDHAWLGRDCHRVVVPRLTP